VALTPTSGARDAFDVIMEQLGRIIEVDIQSRSARRFLEEERKMATRYRRMRR
jgi:hypothetical protein